MSAHEWTVVVVDDDRGCRELHSQYLSEQEVRTAAQGRAALEVIDDSVDLVVLDQEMPGLTGEEVARRLEERGFEGFVVMVSGVRPDFDIVSMPVDDYLVKPVSREQLLATLDRLASRSACQDGLQELFALATRKTRLEAEKSRWELASSEEYRRLTERLAERRSAIAERLAEVDADGDWAAAFEACAGPTTGSVRSD